MAGGGQRWEESSSAGQLEREGAYARSNHKLFLMIKTFHNGGISPATMLSLKRTVEKLLTTIPGLIRHILNLVWIGFYYGTVEVGDGGPLSYRKYHFFYIFWDTFLK